ncbi:hypothetical protein F4703DRAFT_1860769 [Phycomyces blakesleeanus]
MQHFSSTSTPPHGDDPMRLFRDCNKQALKSTVLPHSGANGIVEKGQLTPPQDSDTFPMNDSFKIPPTHYKSEHIHMDGNEKHLPLRKRIPKNTSAPTTNDQRGSSQVPSAPCSSNSVESGRTIRGISEPDALAGCNGGALFNTSTEEPTTSETHQTKHKRSKSESKAYEGKKNVLMQRHMSVLNFNSHQRQASDPFNRLSDGPDEPLEDTRSCKTLFDTEIEPSKKAYRWLDKNVRIGSDHPDSSEDSSCIMTTKRLSLGHQDNGTSPNCVEESSREDQCDFFHSTHPSHSKNSSTNEPAFKKRRIPKSNTIENQQSLLSSSLDISTGESILFMDRPEAIKLSTAPVRKRKKNNTATTTATTTPITTTQTVSTGTTITTSTTATKGGRRQTNRVLYCICQKPYDASRFMIACDECDQWFHGDCVNFTESESELIDSYICTPCTKETGKTISWKTSNRCGVLVARIKAELAESSRQATMSLKSHRSLLEAVVEKKQEKLNSQTKTYRDTLAELRETKRAVNSRVAAIDRKYVLLKKLLQDQTMKRQRLTVDEEPLCGFDSRLIWPASIWEKADGVMNTEDNDRVVVTFTAENIHALERAPPQIVCKKNRKQCHAHTNWQKLQAQEIEKEREEQFRILAKIDERRENIKQTIHSRREMSH